MDNTLTCKSFSVPFPFRLSGSALKVIAVLSMVIDHCAYFLLPEGSPILYEVCRCLGRVAFPLFAYLIAEGFANTRNRMRYFLTLLAFGFVSEIPWFLLNGYDGSHNVMFTLAVGVVALSAFDRLCEHGPLCFASVSLFGLLTLATGTDYDWRGILMIVIFYMLRFQTIQPWITRHSFPMPNQTVLQVLFTFPLMLHYGLAGALLASMVIFLYDGTRGAIKGDVAKYSFYAVYPLHLMMIWCFRLPYCG